ncbi:MAG TPA: altronate dehydratase family protein [Gemmatimonadaceae bacterium]|nr:altronate dehydratase family protein [Gemmatimonadaceae bacterium]
MNAASPPILRIAPGDDVGVALRPLAAGEVVTLEGTRITVARDVPAGHKIALRDAEPGEEIRKYGMAIGVVSAPVRAGDWVHDHNLRTQLSGTLDYRYEPARRAPPPAVTTMPTFAGYRRKNGRVGTRNEIWVLNTVACVNHAAERIAKTAADKFAGRVDGVFAFPHPYGCSQLGDDLGHTQHVLAGLMANPNAGGVLILGLGCENNQLDALMRLAGDIDRDRIAFFNTQDVMDELEQGGSTLAALAERVASDRRTPCPVSDLVLGHKCGGSDGFSGITANPLLGRIADRVSAQGGTVLLTEVPEMFGAERELMARAASREVFDGIAAMVNGFKEYFIRHGQAVYENPSPGNKAGGLTTLEEKAIGAIQKGGHAPVTQVLRYGERVRAPGLALLESPGNDGVSSTAMVASGATLLLFTTGRGTPLGFPVPTVKVSSNSDIARRKPHWIDFNAGALLDGTATMAQLEEELFALVLAVASGERLANNEKSGYREIAIWKDGVTL